MSLLNRGEDTFKGGVMCSRITCCNFVVVLLFLLWLLIDYHVILCYVNLIKF